MRRRNIIIVGAAVLVVASFVMWLMPRQTVQRAVQPKNSVTPVERASDMTSSPPRREEAGLQQAERNRVIAQAIEKTNVPINFWGKVVDQDRQPIDGVSVRYGYSTEHGNSLGVAWGQQKIHTGEVITDVAGRFAVSGIRGHILTIESLTKEGYLYASRGAQTYNYYGDNASGKFTPESANPVVFVMMNQSVAEPLISHGGSFGKTLRLPGTGTAIRWSIWKGQPDPNGEVRITFKREPAVLARVGESVIWSAKIGVVGGGIVEAPPDESFYRAPSEGYVLELEYPKVEQKRGLPARSFYIKTVEAKYGRIELELYPDDEGPTARCLIKAIMNPSGSQNLGVVR